MTDGLGSASYAYDELSRMTSETRAITSVGSFTLSYGYNLAGEVTSITDPFNAQVGYTLDATGKTTAVTGTGFANVTTYASNLQYRAWGALKHLDYGNGLALDMNYNSRLQSSSFDVHSSSGSVLKSSYQYDADGRIHTVDDQVDNLWDRSYSYDFRGMVNTAAAGGAAGLQNTTGVPYVETFGRDAFGNLTNRTTNLWSDVEAFGATYANNRRQSDAGSVWQHDANGEVIGITHPGSPDYQNYQFAASGQVWRNTEHNRHNFGPQTSVVATDLTIDQNYDGDGQRVKRLETTVRQLNNNSPVTSQKTTYELRSTVLGKVITELNEAGVKQKGYVYAGNELLAVQNTQTGNEVLWSHTDPVSESSLQTNASGQVASAVESQRQEIDPMGEAIPPTDPALDESSWIDGAMSHGWYKTAGDPFNPESGCAWNGTSVPCNKVDAILRYSGVGTYIEQRYQGQEGAGFGISIGGYVTHKWGHKKQKQDLDRTNPKTGALVTNRDEIDRYALTITDLTVFGLPGGLTQVQPQNSFVDSLQKRSDTSGDKDIKPPNVKTEFLTPCVQKYLSKFFGGQSLAGIQIQRDYLPSVAPSDALAFTSTGDVISFNKGKYQPNTMDGIALIGHEITHIFQARKYGDAAFDLLYLGDSAVQWIRGRDDYLDNRFEKEAFAKEDEIRADLDEHGNPCP